MQMGYKPRFIMNNNNNKGGQCKKHPKHRQSPGVCSLCVSEKLTRISATSSNKTSKGRAYYCSSSSLSSSVDDSYASSPSSSPPHLRRIASDVLVDDNAKKVDAGFGKSRSMAFVAAEDGKLRPEEKRGSSSNNNNKKKILHPRSNKRLKDHNRKVFMNISQSQPLGATSSSSTVVY
ncbi:hypothetical protein Cgig2_025957 [Carnegiea gigantea]|uniref:Uncharacterized protein n=1 Tax=Carnegiea gigantea TaxID=171969 RepID=A0A9Q1JZJ4_9CARY|nr:hypothetical protein Cgig2_025957 [Carnegiea gigantea]